jgi:beta-glucosidase/6-phospho-beta-glucosidase/beta-galactosidase
MTFLFATGVENSYPLLADGRRVDQMDRCGHYAHWEEDFALVRELGLRALRYGPAYYRAHVAPDHYEWDSCDEQMHRLRRLGIEVIADLCHFGVPTWLGGFQDPAFPVLFAEYARAFAQQYPWVRYYTPIHEISLCAGHSALRGRWNECEASDAAFVRALRNMCMAHEMAVEAILGERPDAVIVQSESLDHVHVDGRQAGEAHRSNALRFLALDLTLGHELAPGAGSYLQAHGVTSNDLTFFREKRAVGQRWIGVDYYASSEPMATATSELAPPTRAGGLRRLATDCYARFRVPLFHCETNHAGDGAVAWLKQQWEDVLALRGAGIPVKGFTWYSLTDTIGWEHGLRIDDNRVHEVGLCNLAREVRAVGECYSDLARRWGRMFDSEPLLQRRA